MFLGSQLLTRVVAACGLALLSVNGAHQCRAFCLLTSCHSIAEDASQETVGKRSASRCCHFSRQRASGSKVQSSDGAANASHNSSNCPGGEPCACCSSPDPAKSASTVEWQGVLDSIPLSGFASRASLFCFDASSSSGHDQYLLIDGATLCVMHCRLNV